MIDIDTLGAYSAQCLDAAQRIELPSQVMDRIRHRDLSSQRFVALGQVTVGQTAAIHVGHKRVVEDPVTRVAGELFFGDLLLRHRFSCVAALPRFTLPVLSGGQGVSGILTEDWTQGKVLPLDEGSAYFDHRNVPGGLEHMRELAEGGVEDLAATELYEDVYHALLPEVEIDLEAFGRMLGRVGGRAVLFDFDAVARAIPANARDPYQSLAQAIALTVAM